MSAKKSPYQAVRDSIRTSGARQLEGGFDAKGLKLAIVVSRYNGELTSRLLEGVLDELKDLGGDAKDVLVSWVPGAYEISSAASMLARTGKFSAIICIGVVVQGETDHARLINEQLSRSLALISREHSIPVLDGVIPAGNLDQAVARASGGKKGRGGYLAKAAVEMARLFEQIKSSDL